MNSIFRAAGLAAALLLAGCGTLSRPPEGVVRVAPGAVIPTADPRIVASDAAPVRQLERQIMGEPGQGPTAILALSGGGANGAYGAGVLVGWTQSGHRPDFRIVTGVSTGALAAPFAFLGPSWDPQLAAAYSDGGAKDILAWRQLATFASPSLYSSSALRKLVDKAVTPQMLTAIAAEHAKGRRLLVATTNLDSEETVIWDMGLIASQGGPQGLKLFKDVLTASASIPGVFPPVLIAGRAKDGLIIQEMHVDGGVNTPFLAVPESLVLWSRPAGAVGGGSIYVLVNGQLARRDAVTAGKLTAILKRSYDSGSKASTRAHLAANAAFAQRNGLAFRVAAVPDEAQANSLDFSDGAMRRLFDLGREQGRSGKAWGDWKPAEAEKAAATGIIVIDAPPARR
ncbi:patatin-like phospholipase family protein [Caulobacter endophyticus]|uniref:Patatin n=1 Tax=Caulobacter endophyticus TaxID=2172652 RepID=A0A2T9K2I2_9CAUL|nr:patatin-like phospholipase family protein [Caulobacter endophyticus]PVM90164.1 patatin [Caulobacter endophyticus]